MNVCFFLLKKSHKWIPCGAMDDLLDYNLEVREFKLYQIHFRTNTFRKGTIYQPLRSGRIWHKVNF